MLLLCMVIIAFAQFREMMLAAASNGWRKTRGTVLDAFFDEQWVSDDNSGGHQRGHVEHSANVRYRYQVNGRDFESTRLSYQPARGAFFGDVVGALKGVYRGRDVDVYYDPRNPARAVLVRGGGVDNVLRTLLAWGIAAWIAWNVFHA